MKQPLSIEAFDYHLPEDRIAAFPLADRDHARLLVYQNGGINDDTFYHLPRHLPPQSTLIVNNTRVIEARLLFQKATGGTIEIFCLEPAEPADMAAAMAQTGSAQWRCLIGGASKWKPGQVLQKELQVDGLATTLSARYLQKEGESFTIAFQWPGDHTFAAVLEAAGAVPLPPYIKRKASAGDADRYQTVFARHKGSVAAPTAALHFTPATFEALEARAILPRPITLHVGAGTFRPVKTATVEEHPMHAESFSVNAATLKELLAASLIVAVGTTSLRTLESLHWLGVKVLKDPVLKDLALGQWEAYELEQEAYSYAESLQALQRYLEKEKREELLCRTSLLIRPGYRFRSARALVTNFHQPRSTLLLLIAAFIGDDWKKVYAHALESGYRFLSYGDSSLLWRGD